MSPSEELQGAIVALLKNDPGVMALVSDIYDRVPREAWDADEGYISFGPEDVVSDFGGCIEVQNISLQLDIWSRKVGRVHAKRIMHEVRRAMRGLVLSENPIVAMGDPFQQVVRDPDGSTTHGILRYEFEIEAHG